MDRALGLWSSAFVTVATILFGLSMMVGWGQQQFAVTSYAICMVLSWAYLVLACSFAAASRAGVKAAASAGVAFAILYSGFVTTVYFVQLTTVLRQAASADILRLLTYGELGGLMFNLELFGYGFTALSTLFIGLTVIVEATADGWLKALLILHGIFAPFCVAAPILNVLGSMSQSAGERAGLIALMAWCLYFIPTVALAFYHFKTYRPSENDR